MTVHTRTVFLVVRASLSSGESFGTNVQLSPDEHGQPRLPDDGGPVRVPEAAFFDRIAADRERDRRELAARDLLNPFWLDYGWLDSLTSLPGDEFRSRLQTLGLRPPEPVPSQFGDVTEWRAWWDAELPGWTDARKDAVWELLDKVRLFEVVEIELVE